MAVEENPMTDPASGSPAASMQSILMAGLSCDVYGLSEIALASPPSSLSCLWLHHPRGRTKEDMASFATRIVSDWHRRRGASSSAPDGRGFVVIAFDQRNHGGRMVEERANGAWKKGNTLHAVDMFSGITGMVSDTRGLMDVVAGYLRMRAEEMREKEGVKGGWDVEVDQHLVLGVSLGGHSAWQTLFGEARVTAGVVVIGCPDYMALMSNRAKLSKLDTGDGDFLGSKYFHKDLIRACKQHDPKGILFGTEDVQMSSSLDDQRKKELREVMDSRVKGKKVLVCSGADDKLVPYAMGEQFVRFFDEATKTWYQDGNVVVDNRVYDGIGHTFSDGMIEDAVKFLLDEVASASLRGVTRANTFGDTSKSKM